MKVVLFFKPHHHAIFINNTHARPRTYLATISPILIANCKDINMSRLKKILNV